MQTLLDLHCDVSYISACVRACVRAVNSLLAALCTQSQVKFDDVETLGRFVQVLGRDRSKVAALGTALGLDGTYLPRSYIEMVGGAGRFCGLGPVPGDAAPQVVACLSVGLSYVIRQ